MIYVQSEMTDLSCIYTQDNQCSLIYHSLFKYRVLVFTFYMSCSDFYYDFVFFLVFILLSVFTFFFFFSSRRRHTRFDCDWSSDVCSSDLCPAKPGYATWPGSRTTVAKWTR